MFVRVITHEREFVAFAKQKGLGFLLPTFLSKKKSRRKSEIILEKKRELRYNIMECLYLRWRR